MMMRIAGLALFFVAASSMLSGCVAELEAQLATWQDDSDAAPSFRLVPLVDRIPHPVFVGHAPGDPDHLYVASQSGVIVRIPDRVPTDEEELESMRRSVTMVLNISDRVIETYEQGLLGLAFHPDPTDARPVFVSYTRPDNTSVIARYAWTDLRPGTVDPESEVIVLELAQPYRDHNGGHIAFGPDGYLYASFGDGGSEGDPHRHAQNKFTMLGSIIRIDVDSAAPYAIPPDNPFTAGTHGAPEVWVYGLRNPWRFTFDQATGDMYIADVGQARYEEINFVSAGESGLNFGWNFFEGVHPFKLNKLTSIAEAREVTFPVAAYGRDRGCAITAGAVYRGDALPDLTGTFLFSDYCKGQIWGLRTNENGTRVVSTILAAGRPIPFIGEDSRGELLVIDHGGVILRALPLEREQEMS